jgi:hypothetical protein
MAILYGTTAEGETLKVLVDQFGNLLAKGIEGPQGPQGLPGTPGVGELPSGATDGALLGWQDGELVWITEPLPPVYVPGFVPIIYTGNGGTQEITGVGFSPSLVWCKSRTSTDSHVLSDIVRGGDSVLYSNLTNSEYVDSNNITSFDSDGFTVGSYENVNSAGENFVAWCWDAGDGTTVTNNDGTLPSQVRSNGDFSVVKWTTTGSAGNNISVGHGLDSSPGLVITKATNITDSWYTAHSFDLSQQAKLDSANEFSDASGAWGNGITSSVIGMRLGNFTLNGYQHVAYCWAETPGVSSFGEYSGGTRQTINTNFRPSLVIIKSTGTGDWFMFDNARGASKTLYANKASTEEETGVVNFLDDGFQLLFALPGVNQSNQTYIYAAFANPQDAAFAQRQLRREARQEERQQNETRLR